MSSSAHLSKELHDFIKSIGETRSKQEEDKIILNEVTQLKPKLAQKNISPKKMKQLLIRALYIEMLGQSAEFAHIHAVNLTQNKNLVLKRIGYLLCSLFFNQSSSLLIMLVSTIQKDLVSTNVHEVVICLTALSKVMSSMIATAVSDLVVKLLAHQTDLVRKKAFLVVQKIQIVHPGLISEYNQKMKKALCDRQPSVMAASLNLYYQAISKNPQKYKQLAPSFVIILKQVIEHKLPKEFDYHRVPAPWIQMKLLQLLSILGNNDQKISQHCYEIVGQALRRSQDTTINIGFALTYQCVKTISRLYPLPTLLQDAASTLSKFLQSTSNNLRYMGIRLLSQMFKSYPKVLNDHQMVVVDCLENKDETLKKQTLELLFKMTNGTNIQVIIKRMLSSLRSSTDPFFRESLVSKIVDLCERFSPNHQWYIDIMHTLFQLGSEYISEAVLNNFLKIVYENYKQNEQFGKLIIERNMELITQVSPTSFIIKMVSWIFGEIGSAVYAQDSQKLKQISEVLIESLKLDYQDKQTKGWVLNSLAKLSSCKGFQMHTEVKNTLELYSSAVVNDVYQRALQYRKLAKYNAALRLSSELRFDKNMSFLNSYIQKQKKQNGGQEYEAKNLIVADNNNNNLRFTPYTVNREGFAVSSNQVINEQTGIKVNTVAAWGVDGYNKDLKKDPIQTKNNINTMTTISNNGNSFSSSQLSKDLPTTEVPTYKQKPKPVVDQKKIEIANSLFGPTTNVMPTKFKGPQPKAKQESLPITTQKAPIVQPQKAVSNQVQPKPPQNQTKVAQQQNINLLDLL